MTGIDILATEEVAIEWAFNWTAWSIIVGIFGGVTLIITIILAASNEVEWVFVPLITTACILVGALIGLVPGFGAGIPTEYETQYKVTISDEVTMTDFLEKYEIIETEGKIYTVREK